MQCGIISIRIDGVPGRREYVIAEEQENSG